MKKASPFAFKDAHAQCCSPLLLILTFFCWAHMNIMVKVMENRLDWLLVLTAIVAFTVPVAVALAVNFRAPPLGDANLPTRRRPHLILPAAAEVSTQVLMFWAALGCPVGDAVTLWSFAVVWTALGVSVLRGKAPSLVVVGAGVIALIGAVLIYKPTFFFGDDYDYRDGGKFPHKKLYLLLSFFISFPHSYMFVANDYVLRDGSVHWSVYHVNFTIVGSFVVSVGWAWFGGASIRLATAWKVVDALGAGVIGAVDGLSRICYIFACQHISGDVIAVFSILDIPITYALGFVFLHQTPDAAGLCGTALIFGAVVAVAVKDVVDNRNENRVES